MLRSDGTLAEDGDFSTEQIARAVEELLATDGISEHLGSMDLGSELVHALKTDLRLRELRDAVAELTNHRGKARVASRSTRAGASDTVGHSETLTS